MQVKILVATIVILAVLPSIFAGRKKGEGRRGNRRRGGDGDCGEWVPVGECVPKKGDCGKGRQEATREGANCRKTSKQIRCNIPCVDDDGCSYDKGPSSQWSECDSDNMMSIEKVLKADAPSSCAATKVFQKPCRNNRRADKKDKKDRKAERKAAKKEQRQQGCKYTRGEWSECVDGQKTRVDTIKKQKPGADCPSTTTKTKKCTPGSS